MSGELVCLFVVLISELSRENILQGLSHYGVRCVRSASIIISVCWSLLLEMCSDPVWPLRQSEMSVGGERSDRTELWDDAPPPPPPPAPAEPPGEIQSGDAGQSDQHQARPGHLWWQPHLLPGGVSGGEESHADLQQPPAGGQTQTEAEWTMESQTSLLLRQFS